MAWRRNGNWRRGAALFAAILALSAGSGSLARADTRHAEAGPVEVERIAGGLKVPWGVDFLPGGEFLVTLRGGKLLHFDSGRRKTTVKGVPRVFARGQGGLLDVAVARDFETTREIFLTFSKSDDRGRAGTALAIAKLSKDSARLESFRIVFEMSPPGEGSRHFGSRIAESKSGEIFVTLGERGDRAEAQHLASHHGAVIRLDRNGTVPGDNPFRSRKRSKPEIWSYGHRNPQGAAFDADGGLWVVEHGARGGDEINRILRGRNYGWPVISYGRHYSGDRIGVGTSRAGMEQPDFYWDPSIAPGGMAIYSGRLWPEWTGHFLVGSLKFDLISRLDPVGGLSEAERLKFPETRRVRDVAEAPDGSIWFLSEDRGAIYRMAPAE